MMETKLLLYAIILIAVVLAVTFVFLAKTDISYSRTDLLLMGTLWLVLTVVFEFGFGHYLEGNSWNALLANYNVLQGRVWVFVPVTCFIAPLLCGALLVK